MSRKSTAWYLPRCVRRRSSDGFLQRSPDWQTNPRWLTQLVIVPHPPTWSLSNIPQVRLTDVARIGTPSDIPATECLPSGVAVRGSPSTRVLEIAIVSGPFLSLRASRETVAVLFARGTLHCAPIRLLARMRAFHLRMLQGEVR